MFPLCPPPPSSPYSFQQSHFLSSCPWVMHISYLASPFPILFLTSPCLFCTYQLCFLIPVTLSPISPFPLPTDNPPNDLYIYFSASVLLVFLVLFLESIVDSHKCIATFYLMLKKVLREYYSK